MKKPEELTVPLPANNLDFNQIATRVAQGLPRSGASSPLTPAHLAHWQATQRGLLGGVVRAKHYAVTAELAGTETTNGTTMTSWRLKMGGVWTVPAVELTRGTPHETVLLVGDAGRKGLAPEVEQLLGEGRRVVVLDPFYFGESHIAQKDFLFALLVAAVGDRPLGLQASQLTAAARWLADARKLGPVKLLSVGPRASVFAT
ncbi:MAG: hypothetical protein EB082_15530, partial [Verrucomicrobia bacterium]|nr:hypothetical protein [Verrucomicrobiota bacterium]